jgi:hypothetical protein
MGSETANHTAWKGNSVSQRLLERIRDAIIRGDYDLTRHAVDEMAEDHLSILDIECVVLDGEIVSTETDDPRGPRHTILGLAEDGKTEAGVVGRFTETDVFLIITVYEVTNPEE